MNCPICSQPFNTVNLLPKTLTCSCKTTICQVCLEKLLSDPKPKCPYDRSQLEKIPVENYPTNQVIIICIDSIQTEAFKTRSLHPEEFEEKRKTMLIEKQTQIKDFDEKKERTAQMIKDHKKSLKKLSKDRFKGLEKADREEEIQDYAARGLEITQKKLKTQADLKEDNSFRDEIQSEISILSSSSDESELGSVLFEEKPAQDFKINQVLKSLAQDLKDSEDKYKNALKENFGGIQFVDLTQENPPLFDQNMNTIVQLIQIVEVNGAIVITPKEYSSGGLPPNDITRNVEAWRYKEKVEISFKKDRIKKDVLCAIMIVFEVLKNVTDLRLDLGNPNLTDKELLALFERQFWQKPSIRKFDLDLRKSQVKSETLTKILSKITSFVPNLTSLELWLAGTKICDEGLEAFTNHTLASLWHLKSLRLDLSGCQDLSDMGFKVLIPVMALTSKKLKTFAFNVSETQITNDLVAFFSQSVIKSLANLDHFFLGLVGTKLDDKTLVQISYDLQENVKKIKELYLLLSRTKVTDLGVQFLASTILPNLFEANVLALELNQTKISDVSLVSLLDLRATNSFQNLSYLSLNLRNTEVSDGGLNQSDRKNFAGMKKLYWFYLLTFGSKVTNQTRVNFGSQVQKSLKHLKVLDLDIYNQ